MVVPGGGHVSPMMVGRRRSVRSPIVWGDMVTIVLGKHGVQIQLACFFSFTPFEVKLVQNKCKSSLNTDVTFRTDRKNMNTHTSQNIYQDSFQLGGPISTRKRKNKLCLKSYPFIKKSMSLHQVNL